MDKYASKLMTSHYNLDLWRFNL